MTEQETLQTFEDAITTHLVQHRDTLVKQAMAGAMDKMSESMKWTVLNQATKQLETFFEEHIGPEIKKYLTDNREALCAQVVATMKGVIDHGLKKQAEEWMKEMDSSYSRSSVIQKMFGGKGY